MKVTMEIWNQTPDLQEQMENEKKRKGNRRELKEALSWLI